MKLLTFAFAVAALLLAAGCSKGPELGAGQDRAKYGTGWSGRAPLDLARDDNTPQSPRRLESVKWDSVKHELTWDVSKGEKKDEGYQPLSSDHYRINMDSATMSVNGETRRFSENEAQNVRVIMDVISKYAVESTVWWEQGQGERLDGSGKPVSPGNPGKPERRLDTTRVPKPTQITSLLPELQNLLR